MLDLPRYLLGSFELLLLGGFAWLGASAIRIRLLPDLSGAPAQLVSAVVALALLVWTAELLGSFSLLVPATYVGIVAVIGILCQALLPRVARRRGSPMAEGARSASEHMGEAAATGPAGRVFAAVALIVAALALLKFGVDTRSKLMTGMTGFDSTWYHGPFAAGFFQSGSTWSLHFIAPQFLAWFYPANAEIFHAAGMLAFSRDILSPLLNFGWFTGCLLACWCIGRPYEVAPWSLALGAVALSLPVLADQAGEARNDIVGIFFLLAAVAIALNAWEPAVDADSARSSFRMSKQAANASLLVGLAAGLAAGTKLNFLLPAAVLVLGVPFLAPAGKRWRALAASCLAALAGGGYWYLRNLIHTGNPLPWFDHLGPIALPAPDQALGGREGHTVLGYLTDGSVWSDWFLPGLHDGLTFLWPLVAALALAGLLLPLYSSPGSLWTHRVGKEPRDGERALAIVALAGLAAVFAWLIAPTSASGPDGMPRGFESGLRYLAPALVLGFALLPLAVPLRLRLAGLQTSRLHPVVIALAMAVLVAIGYPVQRAYLRDRYANPSFAAPGLNAAFKWANGVSHARIATTSTRQYPLFGTDLANHVQYVGEPRPHGGFVAPSACKRWRQLLNAGHYDYVIATRDRIEPGKPPYPDTAGWTEGPGAEPILRKPPTVIFKLRTPLDPSACP